MQGTELILVNLKFSDSSSEHIIYEVPEDRKSDAEIAIRHGLLNWDTEWLEQNQELETVESFIEKELKKRIIPFDVKNYSAIDHTTFI